MLMIVILAAGIELSESSDDDDETINNNHQPHDLIDPGHHRNKRTVFITLAILVAAAAIRSKAVGNQNRPVRGYSSNQGKTQ